jgi:ubiquitin-conjugating enzyme E2 Z
MMDNLEMKNSIITENIVVLSKETTKRLLKDVRELIKQPLDSHGIYYKHDESNILKGYVYICGPVDTQYFGGNYFFEFNFPSDYPHRPPNVVFKTNDGETRFHPNMYRSGKMCLSILNTWKGDQWTGCQSIRTILLTIVSIMDNNPLLHEPGFTENHADVVKFNTIIYFKNFDFTINHILASDSGWAIAPFNDIFKEDLKNQFIKNKESILSILEEKKTEETVVVTTGIYKMNISVDWNNTYNNFLQLKL